MSGMRLLLIACLGLNALTFRQTALAQSPPDTPQLVPMPEQVPSPRHNPTTADKVALGKQLFFDPRLSGDNTMSCATCHVPEKAFADGRARAMGHDGRALARNTPSVLNVGRLSKFTWDGRAASLEEQAIGPITSPAEMNQRLDELVAELNAVPGYFRQFGAVFGRQVNRDDIAKSLAAFQRTLITKSSPLDRYLAGDEDALSPAAKRGMESFIGEADCIRCHHGPLLSDEMFYRLRTTPGDMGLENSTGQKSDRYKFRTPPLRNVAQTGPYMHDGSLQTLWDVVTFYYREVPAMAAAGLPLDVQPLTGQSFSEIDDMVAFLQALSGQAPRVVPPSLP